MIESRNHKRCRLDACFPVQLVALKNHAKTQRKTDNDVGDKMRCFCCTRLPLMIEELTLAAMLSCLSRGVEAGGLELGAIEFEFLMGNDKSWLW